MKFGKNLTHLSIPEWKGYNIDYNDLKKQIRHLTQSQSTNLRPLELSFIENFDHVSLFVKTKYGELNRKLQYFRVVLSHIQTGLASSSKTALATARTKLHEVFYHVVELSIVLKNLSKFILIQKIACKKIFKKLLKYYPDREKSKQLINLLKLYLHLGDTSFVNFDLSSLTLDLTSLFEDIKTVHRAMENPSSIPQRISQPTSNTNTGDGPASPLLLHSSIRKKHSIADSLATNDTVSVHNLKSNMVHNSSFADLARLRHNTSVVFDVKSLLKKNFNLSFLIADDPNTLNESLLTLNVYLNLEILDQNNSLSIIYLQSPKFDYRCPSLIITQADQPQLAIVCYSGGLRQFSYCFLPNEFVQDFLNDPKSLNTLPAQFQSNARIIQTLNCLRYNEFTPKLKIVSKRSRFIFHEGDFDDGALEGQASATPAALKTGTNNGDISNTNTPLHPSNASTTSFSRFEDDYLLTLDYNIYTTNSPALVNLLDLEDYENKMDRFPFATLSVTSNDSNLFNFISNLKTIIKTTDQSETRILENKYTAPTLRRLPEPLQHIIQQESTFNMYKDLSLYDYMLSCYCNIIPQFEENHYANLLYLNLLKKLEEVNEGVVNGESTHGEEKQQLLRRVGSTIGVENWNIGGGGGGGFGGGWGKHGPNFNGGGGGGVDGDLGNVGGGAGGGGGGGYDRGRFDGGGGGGGGLHDNSPTTSSTPHSSKSVFTDPHGQRPNKTHSQSGDYDHTGANGDDEDDDLMMFDSVDDDNLSMYIRPQKRSALADYFASQMAHEVEPENRVQSALGWLTSRFQRLRYWLSGYHEIDDAEFNDIYGQFLGPESSFGNYYYYYYSNNGRGEKWHNDGYGYPHVYGGYDSENMVGTPGHLSNYDSINEDPSFLTRDAYQLEYQYQYEQSFDINLSYIYFALCVISVLSSGIALGIIYTILHSSSDPLGRVWIFDNLGLFITLVLILFFSLMFSFMSVNLNFQRFLPTPKSHQLVLWSGLILVLTCAMTSFVILISLVS